MDKITATWIIKNDDANDKNLPPKMTHSNPRRHGNILKLKVCYFCIRYRMYNKSQCSHYITYK